VAVVVAALGVSGAAAAGGTARPGDAGFAMTRVFFSERARSLEAAQVVADGLARAKVYIAQRQPALAAQELADVENRLPDVRDSDGHTRLLDEQQQLAAAVALTPPAPPAPPDQRSTDTPNTAGTDPDTSILAEPAPATSSPDASTPDAAGSGGADVVTAPSENATSGGGAAPEKGSAAQPGSGTAATPPEASTSTVSGATDQGTVTAEPTTSGTDDATTTVTTTSEPTDPTTTSTSRTAEPTTSTSTSTSTSTPPPSTTAPSGDEGTVATGSVPADDASIVVPAAHHEPVDPPVAAVPPPVAHPAPVVVTTVPSPVRGDGAGARPPGVADIHPRSLAEPRISRVR
jgi:hypothetical protein